MSKKRNCYSVTSVDGATCWYDGEMLHREDGPAVIQPNGDKFWWYEDLEHRIGGPAQDYVNGDQIWMVHGKAHRLDGPAIIVKSIWEYHPISGEKITPPIIEWWVNGEYVPCSSQEQFEKLLKLKVFW